MVRAPLPAFARLRIACGWILVMALAASLAGAILPQAALAVDNGTLGIRPSNESDFFHLTVLPGDQLDATAIVTNHTAEPVTLLTYPVDGQSTPGGAFALASENAARTEIGAWAVLNGTQIVVPAESQLGIPFRIVVPIGTQPGDYAGGLIIQSPPVQGETNIQSGTPMRIDVVQRQGVRIYLNVPGKAVKALNAGGLAWTPSGRDVTITLPVTNTGNTTLFPTASVTVDRWFAAETTLKFSTPESVLPGATVNLTAKLAGVDAVRIGSARATVTSAAGTDIATTNFFNVPWLILVGVGVLLAALIFGVWRVLRFVRKARRLLTLVARETARSSLARDGAASGSLPTRKPGSGRHAYADPRAPLD